MNPKTFYSNTEICRVCPRTVNLINLYDPSNKIVLNDLNLIVYIENEDVTLLPKFICLVCKKSLKNFMDFKIQCEERDKEMRENIRLSQGSKENFKSESPVFSDLEDSYGNNEVESYVEEEESQTKGEDSEKAEDDEEEEEEDSTEINDKNLDLLNQLKDRESETTYNDIKEILDKIPVSKMVKTRQCIHCEAIFDTANKCREHVLSEHGWSGSYKYNCIVCKKEFLSWTELSKHKRNDHKKCTECPKVFGTYPLMRDHFRRVHIKKPKPGNENFPCKLCGRIFKLKASIRKHIRSFHNNERPNHCEICGKGFFEIVQLRSHQTTHTNDRPIICDFTDCGKTFKSVEHLKSHQRAHLSPEKKKLEINIDKDPRNFTFVLIVEKHYKQKLVMIFT